MTVSRKARTQYDERLDELVECAFSANMNDVDAAAVKPICEESNIYFNSLNLFVGPQGYGKTYSALLEIVKISHFSPETHLLVFVSKKGYDPTFEALKKLLFIPYLQVTYDEAEDLMIQLTACKKLYKQIKHEHLEDMIDESQRDAMFETLHIKNFKQPWLNTCWVFDDCTNQPMFRNEKSYMSQQMAILRDINCTVFMTSQFYKGITTTIKSNVTCTYITRGFSPQQLRYISSQITLPIDFESFHRAYSQLNGHEKLIVNNRTNEVVVE